MVRCTEHLVVSAIEFVLVNSLRTAAIGRIYFCNHDCRAVFLARIAYRRRIGDRENRFASLKKRFGTTRPAIPSIARLLWCPAGGFRCLKTGIQCQVTVPRPAEAIAPSWSGSSLNPCPRLKPAGNGEFPGYPSCTATDRREALRSRSSAWLHRVREGHTWPQPRVTWWIGYRDRGSVDRICTPPVANIRSLLWLQEDFLEAKSSTG